MLTRFINRLEEGVIALLLAAMTLITFTQVVARYFFDSGAVWALELTTYLFAWMVLFGVSYGVRVGAHIGVDAAVKLLPPKTRHNVMIIAVLCCLLYCGLLFYGAWEYITLIYELEIEAEDLPIQQWIPYSILPIGLALLFFRFSQLLYRLLTGEDVHMLVDEAEETLKEHHEHEAHDKSGNSGKGDPL